MPIRRRLAYIAASVIAATGMFAGHTLGKGSDDSSAVANLLGIGAWVVAGIVAVLIDRSVPARAVGFASLALPLVWFGTVLVSEGVGFWFLALLLIAVFALLAALSAAATRLLFRLIARSH